jgi:DNA-directed RNA polymerase sigma subunit (sigma70/sigma32)
MNERERVQIAQTPEAEHASPSLLWAQQDYLSELLAARYRNPDVANFDELVQLSALPPDHASKMKKQTKDALGKDMDTGIIDEFEGQLHESGAPMGIDPKDVDYDQSWRTCRMLARKLRMRQDSSQKGRDLSQLDSYGHMKYTLGEHHLLEPGEEHALSAIIWSARSQLSLARPDLGQILRSGRYEEKSVDAIAKDLADEPHLRQLFQHYREALDTLTLYNQRLALGYLATRSTSGVRSEEVMVGAQLGLRRAAELYDASTGLKFSTFATPWLRQSVDREVARADLIQLPARVREQRSVLNGVIAEITSTIGRVPTAEEIALHIEQLKKNMDRNDSAPKRYDGLTAEAIARLLHGPRVAASLDKVADEDDPDSRTLYETARVGITDDVAMIEAELALRSMADKAGFTSEERMVFSAIMKSGASLGQAGLIHLLEEEQDLKPNRARTLVRRVREKLRNLEEYADLVNE